jgi:predicted permease
MRRKRAASDFNAEVEAHIQLEADRLRGQGMPEAEAQAAARRAFGNVVKAQERFFESGRWLWWERLRQDLRYALRMLAKTPGFSAIAILTLGLGIGANTAIFSLIDAVLLRSLPVPHPEELMQVFRLAPNRAGKGNPVFANPLWERVRDQQDIFRDVFAWKGTIFDLAQGGEVQRADGLWVSGGFFPTLQIQPAAGRLLTAADDRPGCPALAVLGYSFWQDRFAGDPGAVGGSISLDQHAFQVIGVSAKGFSGLYAGGKFDVAVPLCATAVFDGNESRLPKWSLWWLDIGGRLKPGFTLEQVNARLAALSPAIVRGTGAPVWLANSRLKALPGASGISTLWTQFETPMYVLIAIVGLVLLIACSNIASLMLARATARNRELAVRQAMGASRWRLIRQLLTECLVLSSAGALLGILVARWGSALLVRCISTAQSHIFLDLTPDLRVLGFTGALAVLTAMLFGLLPSWRGTRVSVSAAMKGSSDFEQRARFRPAKWIVASQVALSLVLLLRQDYCSGASHG